MPTPANLLSVFDHIPAKAEIEKRLRETLAERAALLALLRAAKAAERIQGVSAQPGTTPTGK